MHQIENIENPTSNGAILKLFDLKKMSCLTTNRNHLSRRGLRQWGLDAILGNCKMVILVSVEMIQWVELFLMVHNKRLHFWGINLLRPARGLRQWGLDAILGNCKMVILVSVEMIQWVELLSHGSQQKTAFLRNKPIKASLFRPHIKLELFFLLIGAFSLEILIFYVCYHQIILK